MVEFSSSQSSITKNPQQLLDEDFIPLESEDNSESIIEKNALVSKIISVKAFNRFIVINVLKKGWNNLANMSIVEVNSLTFVFRFQECENP